MVFHCKPNMNTFFSHLSCAVEFDFFIKGDLGKRNGKMVEIGQPVGEKSLNRWLEGIKINKIQ